MKKVLNLQENLHLGEKKSKKCMLKIYKKRSNLQKR